MYPKSLRRDLAERQADPIDAYRTFFKHKRPQTFRISDQKTLFPAFLNHLDDLPHAVHVSQHKMALEASRGFKRPFQIHKTSRTQLVQIASFFRLIQKIEKVALLTPPDNRQAYAVDRETGPFFKAGIGGVDPKKRFFFAGFTSTQAADRLNDACEHLKFSVNQNIFAYFLYFEF